MLKMNYLLIMPRFVDKVGEWYHFPLGIPYVSSSLKKEAFQLYTLNLNNEEGTIDDILKQYIMENDINLNYSWLYKNAISVHNFPR